MSAGAASGWGSGEPGGFVFGAAGEPAGAEQAVQHGKGGSFADLGAVADVEAVELSRVIDEVTQDGEQGSGDAQSVDGAADFADWVARIVERRFPGGLGDEFMASLAAEAVRLVMDDVPAC